MSNIGKCSPAIAMVATRSASLPDMHAILAAAALDRSKGGFFHRLLGRKALPKPDAQWDNSSLVVPFAGGQLAVALMPAAIPCAELEGPCATAWWWPTATEAMRAHTHHFVCALIGGAMDPIERRVVLTRVVRAVAQHTDAAGIYWGEGTLVHEPGEFIKKSAGVSFDNIPGPLWIDFRIEAADDGNLRCFTTGLAPLGFREIEVRRSSLRADELMAFLCDIACYIVNGRKQINNNETMGRTASERYRVRITPSMFDRGEVMQLEMM